MAYVKDFKKWGLEKEMIHVESSCSFFPRSKEIIFAKWGVNIGFEADGKKSFLRPVLVLKKIGSLYWVLPLTSQLKNNIFHHRLESVTFSGVTNSLLMLSQAKVIDAKRFVRKIGEISNEEYRLIQKKIKKLYF